MSMGIFFKQKDKIETALVFDIGSSSVGGALLEINKSGTPKILKTFREPIEFEEKIDIDRFLFLTLKSLQIIVGKMCLLGVGKQVNIFCVLSSPFYALNTRIIKLEKNEPFLFTSLLADSLIVKEINLFKAENSLKFSQDNHELRLIEFKNIKTMLNGYTTLEPYNKKCKKLEMVILISISGNQILEKIENTIRRHFQCDTIKFSSFAISSFITTREIFPNQENFILVDITGEVTDISLINKDIIVNSISYPLGANFTIREIAKNLNCSLSEAKSFFSLYKDGHLKESFQKKLEPILSKLKGEWLQNFQKSLNSILESISIPTTVYITVDRELEDFFSKIIKTEQFNQYSFTESEFKVVFLNSETLHGKVQFESDTSRDPFLTIESIYINRFLC